MNWLYIALIPPAIWALSNHFDKYLIGKYFKNASAISFLVFTCLVGTLGAILILLFKPEVLLINLRFAPLIIFNGFLYVAALLPYLYALKKDDTSIVVPLFQTIPVFAYILGSIFLKESLSMSQIAASLLIISGAVGITLEIENKKITIKKEVLILMLISSFLVALGSTIFKIVAINESFWTTGFWQYLGYSIFGIIILSIKKYRLQFLTILKTNKLTILGLSTINESINVLAQLIMSFATLLAPLALVWTINGLQPFFVFIYGIILTSFFPKISQEKINKHIVIQKLIFISIMIVGVYFLNK